MQSQEGDQLLPERPSRRRFRKLNTAAVLLTSFATGLTFLESILGPSMIRMQVWMAAGKHVLAVSYLVNLVGYSIGSWMAHFLVARWPVEPQVALTVLLKGFFTACAPIGANLGLFFSMSSLSGLAHGALECGTLVYIIQLWDGHRLLDAVNHCFHFCWAVGAALSPLIVDRFLRDQPISSSLPSFINSSSLSALPSSINSSSLSALPSSINSSSLSALPSSINSSSLSALPSSINSSSLSALPSSINSSQDQSVIGPHDVLLRGGHLADITLPWVIVGLICVPISAFNMLGFVLRKCQDARSTSGPPLQNDAAATREGELEVKPQLSQLSQLSRLSESSNVDDDTHTTKVIAAFLVPFFIGFSLCENLTGAFLASFLQEKLGWSFHSSTISTTVLQFSNGFGRLVVIPASYFVGPTVTLSVNMMFLVCGSTFLLLSPNLPGWLVMASVVMIGLGTSTLYAGFVLWCNRYVNVGGVLMSVVITAAGVGILWAPPLLGYVYEQFTPMWFPYFISWASFQLLTTCVCAFLWSRMRTPKKVHSELTAM